MDVSSNQSSRTTSIKVHLFPRTSGHPRQHSQWRDLHVPGGSGQIPFNCSEIQDHVGLLQNEESNYDQLEKNEDKFSNNQEYAFEPGLPESGSVMNEEFEIKLWRGTILQYTY